MFRLALIARRIAVPNEVRALRDAVAAFVSFEFRLGRAPVSGTGYLVNGNSITFRCDYVCTLARQTDERRASIFGRQSLAVAARAQ